MKALFFLFLFGFSVIVVNEAEAVVPNDVSDIYITQTENLDIKVYFRYLSFGIFTYKTAIQLGSYPAAGCGGTATTTPIAPPRNTQYFTETLTGPFSPGQDYYVRVCTDDAGDVAPGTTAGSFIQFTTNSQGKISFEKATHYVAESQSFVRMAVVRTGGSVGAVSFDVELTGVSATGGVDFNDTTLNVTMLAGVKRKYIKVPIIRDVLSERTESFLAVIKNASSPFDAAFNDTTGILVPNSTVTIYDVQTKTNDNCPGGGKCILVKLIDPSQPDFREVLGTFPVAGDGSYNISGLKVPLGYKFELEVIDQSGGAGAEYFKRTAIVDIKDNSISVNRESTIMSDKLDTTSSSLAAARQAYQVDATYIDGVITTYLGASPDEHILSVFLKDYDSFIAQILDGDRPGRNALGNTLSEIATDPNLQAP